MKAREGDYIEDRNGIIFDVKGLIHPPNMIIAFPRFIPALDGKRKHANLSYNKIYSLSRRFAFLEENYPQYLVHDKVFNERLCEVPLDAVKRHYKPDDCLQRLRSTERLDKTEKTVLQFMELLKENAGEWSKLGISGSIMVKLHTPSSDIDPIVYGSKTCYKVHSALKPLLEDNKIPVKRYSSEELKKLFDFRSKDTVTSFEDFVRTDSRKISQGKFMGRDYFIRFVKDWNEVKEQYGTTHYKPEGYAKIKARVVDDSEVIFTPCCYKIDNVKILEGPSVESIEEIVSFRGRFCEQARSGEVVIAQGKVEKLQIEGAREHFRVLLGNKVSDHMILA